MSASTAGLSKFRDSIEFLYCLHFAIVNSEYSNIILNSLINDQLQKINHLRQRAVVLSVKGHDSHESEDQEKSLDLTNVDASRLKKGDYEYIFTHPETCLSSKQGVSLFQSNVYKNSVAAVVVDEAHCILEW